MCYYSENDGHTKVYRFYANQLTEVLKVKSFLRQESETKDKCKENKVITFMRKKCIM